MTVSIAWSLTQGGTEITTTQNLGTVGNGSTSSELSLWIEHNGDEDITDCGFYARAYSGTYSGGASAADDYDELLVWGDSGEGFQINQNTYDGADAWTAVTSSAGTVSAPIELNGNSKHDAGDGVDGIMSSGDQHKIEVRIEIPAAEATAGKRQWDFGMAYTYTS